MSGCNAPLADSATEQHHQSCDELWLVREQLDFARAKLLEAESTEHAARDAFLQRRCEYDHLRCAVRAVANLERKVAKFESELQTLEQIDPSRECFARRSGLQSAELVLNGRFNIADQAGPWLSIRVLRELQEIDQRCFGLEQIDVRIDCKGGNLDDGFTIYDVLLSHPAKVRVLIDGEACSAAALVALAGDHVRMTSNSRVMLHSCRLEMAGTWTHAELSKACGTVATSNRRIAELLAARTRLSAEQIDAVLTRDVWFTAEEALAAGLAHEIVPQEVVR